MADSDAALDRPATPFLDQIEPTPEKYGYWDPGGDHPGLACFVVLSFGLLFWTAVFQNYFWFNANVIFSMAYLYGAWYPCCFVHELGHVMAAALFRRKLISFRTGPILFVRNGGAIQVRFDSKHWLGGAVQYLPNRRGVSRFEEAIIAAAGPGASALLAGWVAHSLPAVGSRAATWELPAVCMSCFYTLVSLWPHSYGSEASDGYQLWRLLGRGGTAHCALVDLLGRIDRREPPSSWTRELVESAATDAKLRSERLVANYLAFKWACIFDPRRAPIYLDAALSCSEHAPKKLRAELFRDASAVQIRRGKTTVAADWFARAVAIMMETEEERGKKGASLLPLEIRSTRRKRRGCA